jgi:ribosomal protein S18 acetylase RimI-like enzyme
MDDQVTLQPVTEDDLSFLEHLTNDRVATGEHEWHGFADPGALRRGWAETGLLGDSQGVLMVVARDAGRAGQVSWRKTQTGAISYCWGIGIGLAPEFRGRGYGCAAQRLLVRYLFANTQVNRIEAETEITNLAEQRALEKAGFTREGVRRGATYRAGRWHDSVLYGVLRAEVELDAGGMIST